MLLALQPPSWRCKIGSSSRCQCSRLPARYVPVFPFKYYSLKLPDQTIWQDLPSFDWPNSQIDSSLSPSPISTSASSTPPDSTPFDSTDWFMGALALSKSAPSRPFSPMHWPAEWEAFTFGI